MKSNSLRPTIICRPKKNWYHSGPMSLISELTTKVKQKQKIDVKEHSDLPENTKVFVTTES